MPINFDKLQSLYRGDVPHEQLVFIPSLRPFSDEVCSFLSTLSKRLLADSAAKAYPDVITFGFFCRRASVQAMKSEYPDCDIRLGKGITFHIAPSNVPINFAYSMAAGLLAGNACIVRVSSTHFEQVDIVCRAIGETLAEDACSSLRNYISIVRYEHDPAITAFFSSLCDIRVIWGGDNTISEIRKAPLPPRSYDITFADRYSICLLDAGYILSLEAMDKLVQGFFNDTYLYDQNACSSPRLMVWFGSEEDRGKAKARFWDAVHRYLLPRYSIEPVIAVDKLMTLCRCAIDFPHCKQEPMPDNLISRIHLESLSGDITEYRCPGGSFLEYDCERLDELNGVVTRKYQTLSVAGPDSGDIRAWIVGNGLSGIDRIVPVGKTADFSLVWDGYDLIRQLSRVIDIA